MQLLSYIGKLLHEYQTIVRILILKLKEIENNYQILSQIIEILENKLELSYFDALCEALSNILDEHFSQIDELDQITKDNLNKLYGDLDFNEFKSEDYRQLIQLLLLNSYKKEIVQTNHQMTPDSIGFLVAFLIEKLVNKENVHSILDIGVGTGNLLTTVVNNLNYSGYNNLNLFGIDNDDTLLEISDISLALQKHKEVQLYHQDAIESLMVPKVDIVVSDVPVGYYPIDENVETFKSKLENGHSYAHYLFIEQAMRQLKDGAWGFFIVPSDIFSNKESQRLINAIRENGYLQGMLNLPKEMFVSEKSRKSILFVQKKGKQARQAKQVLLGDFPSLKDKKEFEQFLNEINIWAKENII